MFVAFGASSDINAASSASSPSACIAIPVLGARNFEQIAETHGKASSLGCLQIAQSREHTIGIAELAVDTRTYRSTAYRIYNDIFDAFRGLDLYRIWNYAPAINEGEGDEENYRQFCSGRSEAFEKEFGALVDRSMPAGTCVGCDGDKLVVIVVAGETRPDHFENPKQIPAYQYPREYGPRSPSFARASSVTIGDRRYRYISGTAAVLGHESKGVGNLDEQLEITCDNLDTIIAETMDTRGTRFQTSHTAAAGKVYLRHSQDYEKTKEYFERRFPEWHAGLIYLRSDLCRKELLLEAEFSFVDRHR